MRGARPRRARRDRGPRDPRRARERRPRTPPGSSSAGTAESRTLSPPNSSISNPNRSSVGRVRDERLALRRRQLDQHRRQQPLALEPARRQPLHHLLEQHPLVRDVLIDDRDPLVVDRDDERVAELPERDHRADRRSRGSAGSAGFCRFCRVLPGSTGFAGFTESAGFGAGSRRHQVAPRAHRL